jgi:hypothetical protein
MSNEHDTRRRDSTSPRPWRRSAFARRSALANAKASRFKDLRESRGPAARVGNSFAKRCPSPSPDERPGEPAAMDTQGFNFYEEKKY